MTLPARMPRSLAMACAAAMALSASPAFAGMASDTFKDVAPGHWAEQGVVEVALKRDLMKGDAQGYFRGEAPLTRYQFAESLKEVIRELEALSRTSWRQPRTTVPAFAFEDAPAGEVRTMLLSLANDYGLFDSIPDVTSYAFYGGTTVTRYEMAVVIDNLMRRAEALDLVRPKGNVGSSSPTFSDLDSDSWAFAEVLEVSRRYRVMVGFPDGSFRGPEGLTRFQYAQAISQTFPMIRALVTQSAIAKTLERQNDVRLQALTPLRLDLAAGVLNPGQANGGVDLSLRGRYVAYPDNWFVLSETRLGLLSGLSLSEEVGGMLALPTWGAFQFQPYAGAQALLGGSAGGIGPSLGAIARWGLADGWGLYGKANMVGVLAGQAAGQMLIQYELGADAPLFGNLKGTAGVASWEAPAAGGKDGHVALTAGVELRF